MLKKVNTFMTTDNEFIERVRLLSLTTNPNNVGDVYVQVANIYSELTTEDARLFAEQYIDQIRSIARNADIGWQPFSTPAKPARALSDEEQVQILAMISTLRTFCYGMERLNEVSLATGPDSPPVRFYINSIYHHIAAFYLIDKGKDPLGGTIYKTLEPMGLSSLLEPISLVLNKPMEGDITFGETIRNIRNDFLVHGSFSPIEIASVVKKTQLHDLRQKVRLSNLLWELFNQSFILKLKLISIVTNLNIDLAELMTRYITKIYPDLKPRTPQQNFD